MKCSKMLLFALGMLVGVTSVTHATKPTKVKTVKPASKVHPKKHGRRVYKKNPRHGDVITKYHSGLYASANERLVSPDEASKELVAAFDTYCKRYRIHLEPKQRTKHLRRVQAIRFDAPSGIYASEIRDRKRELKNYLKIYYPDKFRAEPLDTSIMLTWKQAKTNLQTHLMALMKNEFGFAPTSTKALHLWERLKKRIDQKLDNAAIFDESGLWVIDRARMPALLQDAENECRHLYDLFYTELSSQRLARTWRSARGR